MDGIVRGIVKGIFITLAIFFLLAIIAWLIPADAQEITDSQEIHLYFNPDDSAELLWAIRCTVKYMGDHPDVPEDMFAGILTQYLYSAPEDYPAPCIREERQFKEVENTSEYQKGKQ